MIPINEPYSDGEYDAWGGCPLSCPLQQRVPHAATVGRDQKEGG